jgi:hydrogenase maturation protease
VRYLIGIGTYTAFDDSIGLRVAEAIADEELDRGFRVVELGGNLLDLAHYLERDTEAVLIVDAARMGHEPGEWAYFTPDEVATRKDLSGLSTHEGDLMKVLDFAAAAGKPIASVTIMGIEPAEVRDEVGLSPVLAARFLEYVQAAVGFFG